jgi:hypothetical protein
MGVGIGTDRRRIVADRLQARDRARDRVRHASVPAITTASAASPHGPSAGMGGVGATSTTNGTAADPPSSSVTVTVPA